MAEFKTAEAVVEATKAWVTKVTGIQTPESSHTAVATWEYDYGNGFTLLAATPQSAAPQGPQIVVINLVYGAQLKSVLVDTTIFTKDGGIDTPKLHGFLTDQLIATPAPLRESSDKAASQQRQQQTPEFPLDHPAALFGTVPAPAAAPRGPASAEAPPKFDDEYQVLGSGSAAAPGAHSGLAPIGDRDLNPPGLPKHPTMSPFIDPLAGSSEGGMYPTADHPLFNGRAGQGLRGGPRYDDPMLGDGAHDLDMIGSGLPGNLGGPGRRGNPRGPFGGPGGPGGFPGSSSFGGGFI